MAKLAAYEKQMLASPDQQISLTDPDSRSMATSGRGSGVVGYNVQVAVDTEHHLIVTHEVTNMRLGRGTTCHMWQAGEGGSQADKLEAVADRGYFNGEEILACEQAGITVTLPKPMTSGAKAQGRFGKQDFVYLPDGGCLPLSGRRAPQVLLHSRRSTDSNCVAIGPTPAEPARSSISCTTGHERRITRWEHEHVSRRCSRGSMRTRKPCASGARRSSIRSAR